MSGSAHAEWIEPMLATAGTAADLGATGGWLMERKLDGLRALAVRDGERVELWSRNHLSFSRRFPGVVAALGEIDAGSFVIDGELVAHQGGADGFGLIARPGPATVVTLVAFDLLVLLGRDVTGLALEERRRLLRMTIGDSSPALAVSEDLVGEPAQLLERACAAGWEGLVAKRLGSRYVSGRSSDWRKLKCVADQELVIGGWSEPRGTRSGLGALLVGVYDDEARLLYAGKVGTGFSEATLRDLRAKLTALETPSCPFSEPIRLPGLHWARPELVTAVGFTEWTADGKLRHPRFVGLRPDKDPTSVRRDPPPAVSKPTQSEGRTKGA